ncbi:MAG: hypothetical protein HYS27_07325 [Deltaproteobacteria bacterium]|nr:hypothetical protein [Deltaproteobacteria bacterium]
MATFADFALLRTSSSYGGAEIVRARRVTEGGVEPPVHLALFGTQSVRDAALEQRLLDLAEAAAPLDHEAVARIAEVGRYDGSLYAATAAVEGIDLATLLEHERRRRAKPDARFVLAVAFSLARVVQDLHELGDVWAAGGVGLSVLFPDGLRPEAVVLRADGAVLLRVLAGALAPAGAPTPFRAPELVEGAGSAASDVFATIQVLRALLAVDVNAQAAPRLPEKCAALPTLLVSALQKNPEDRPTLDATVDTLRAAFADNAPNQAPAAVITTALRRDLRALLPDERGDDAVPAAAIDEIARRRGSVLAGRTVLFPRVARRAPPPTRERSVVATVEMHRPVVATVAMRRLERHREDDVDRVFTQEGDTSEGASPSSLENTSSRPSVPPANSDSGAVRSSILDVAAASIGDSVDKTQKQLRDAALDVSSELFSSDDSSPWMAPVEVSGFGPADVAVTPQEPTLPPLPRPEPATVAVPPPFAAPVFADSDLEHQDTVEMKQPPGAAPRDVTLPPIPAESGPDEKKR